MEREIFIDNLLVRAHLIIEMSRPALRHGSLNSLFPVAYYVPSHTYGVRVGMATLFCGSIMWDGEVSAYLGRNQNLKDIKAPPPYPSVPPSSHLALATPLDAAPHHAQLVPLSWTRSAALATVDGAPRGGAGALSRGCRLTATVIWRWSHVFK